MRTLTLAALFLGSLPVLGAVPGLPNVIRRGNLLVAVPAPNHQAQGLSMEILETEECEASRASTTSLRVSGKCSFLRALFSYEYPVPGEDAGKLKSFVGFTYASGGKGHSLMVSGPFVVPQISE